MAAPIENWDDDADFGDGPEHLFSHSVQSLATNLSSRLSIKSGESNAGDDNWEFVMQGNDENATKNAILGAKQAGIPIPQNVPSSALTGGTIKRLGRKKSRKNLDEDWGLDIDLPSGHASPLKLKPELQKNDGAKRSTRPTTPANDNDDFDLDWAEGSLGVRVGGTRRELRNRSSSASAMSPSMGSCMTLESEEDGMDGLVLPTEPIDFATRLSRRKEAGQDGKAGVTSSPQPPPAREPSPFPDEPSPWSHPKLTAAVDDEDPLSGLDVGTDLIDRKKHKLNGNIKISSSRIQVPPVRSTTTLTFTDKAHTSRIPRPTSTKQSKLDPVYEPGAVQATRTTGRPAPTTTSSQLLRAKRSAPVLRSGPQLNSKSSGSFLSAGTSSSQSHHVSAKVSHPPSSFRRDSNPERGQSPPPRSFSRLSRFDGLENAPSRAGFRKDVASGALAREAQAKRNIIRPTRRRNFGDGTELDMFDDLPTSAQKENQFIKQPTRAGPPRPMLKSHASLSRLMTDRTRMQTPLPPSTPTTAASTATGNTAVPSTPRGSSAFPSDNTPRFARDTAASRNAREQRLGGGPRSRDGPLNQVQTNWKAQVALRNPHLSPTAHRNKKGDTKKPQLIKWMGAESVRNEKGMTYNLALNRWDGNEIELNAFYQHDFPSATTLPSHPTHTSNHSRHHHTNSIPSGLGLLQPQAARSQPYLGQYSHSSTNLLSHQPPRRQEPSPPRRAPALISHVNTGNSVQVEKGMVFDPRLMKWLKIAPGHHKGGASPSSMSVEDEDDPFGGIEDLPDDNKGKSPDVSLSPPPPASRNAGSGGGLAQLDELMVGEEFDVGPAFVRKQREEEVLWRRRVEGWIGHWRDELGEGWRWSIRERAMEWEAERAVAAAAGRG